MAGCRVRGGRGALLLLLMTLLLMTHDGDAQTTDCASTAAGCSGYSLIAAGSCATTADCEAIATEADCRALHLWWTSTLPQEAATSPWVIPRGTT